MVANNEVQQSALARIDAAHAAIRTLASDGPVRAVLTDAYVDECRAWVRNEGDLENALWPPLLPYAMMPWHSPQQLRLLDADVRSIRDHPTSDPMTAVRWLAAKGADGRLWRGGLFETSVKARALAFATTREDWTVAFDVPLPSGRNVDIVLTSGDRSYFLECTVITESDEDQEVHAAWTKARKKDPRLLLARPGPFDTPTSKGASAYYDANRFYIKIFDKLQKDGDRSRTQTSDDYPNLLLLSCFPVFGSPLPFSPGLGWALSELFSRQPNMGSVKTMPPNSPVADISLLAFLRSVWPATALDLLECPGRLSGVLTFNCLGLDGGRINYNANKAQQLTHLEMACLESIFMPIRGWETLSPSLTTASPDTA